MSFVKICVGETVLFLLVEGNYIDTLANIKLYDTPNVKNVLAKSLCYVT